MAVIDNVVRVTTNRAGAVSDVVARLESSTATVINIDDQHLSDDLVRTGNFNTATGGINIDATTGAISAEVSIGSQHVYRSTATSGTQAAAIANAAALRNAAPSGFNWHIGDSAILLSAEATATTDAWYFAPRSYLYTGGTSGDNHDGTTVDADWTLTSDAAAMGVTPISAGDADSGDTLIHSITIAGTTYRLPTAVVAGDLSLTRVEYTASVPSGTAAGVHNVTTLSPTPPANAFDANTVVYLGGARLLPHSDLTSVTPDAGTYSFGAGNTLYLNFSAATGADLDVLVVDETFTVS